MAKRRRKPCGQPMPNAHGEPSGHILCGLPAGHPPPHVCATDYVRHAWEPPGSAPAPVPAPTPPAAPAPKPKPAKPAAQTRKPRKPPARRRRGRRIVGRRPPRRRDTPLRAFLEPIGLLVLAVVSLHIAGLLLNDPADMSSVRDIVDTVIASVT